MSERLKLCPFCGGQNDVHVVAVKGPNDTTWLAFGECLACGGRGGPCTSANKDVAESCARELWERRTNAILHEGQLAELEARVKELELKEKLYDAIISAIEAAKIDGRLRMPRGLDNP